MNTDSIPSTSAFPAEVCHAYATETDDHGRRIASLEAELAELRASVAARHADAAPGVELVSMTVFSNDLDSLLASMTIANGAAMSGCEVHMFFAFWAAALLRRPDSRPRSVIDRLFCCFLSNPRTAKLSRMHWGGIGSWMLKRRMRQANIAGLEEQLEMAAELGVRFHVCDTSMTLLGIAEDDLIDYPNLDICGVATFVEQAMNSRMTLNM